MTEDDKFRIELHRSDSFYGDPLAADRIEELLELNKELTLQLLATSGQAADALDKLDKAVAALREIITRWDTPSWKDAEATGSVINRARTKLAELEGMPT